MTHHSGAHASGLRETATLGRDMVQAASLAPTERSLSALDPVTGDEFKAGLGARLAIQIAGVCDRHRKLDAPLPVQFVSMRAATSRRSDIRRMIDVPTPALPGLSKRAPRAAQSQQSELFQARAVAAAPQVRSYGIPISPWHEHARGSN